MAITKVTNSLVSVNAIHGTLIADNAITSVHIAQNQVTSVQIPDSSITSTQLAANSVDTAELISGSIDAIHLASDSVTTAKILNANITTAKIANNAITSALIPDGSITDTQLGSGAFTMGTITTTGAIRGPASLTIDPATVGDNTGTVVIAGNLQVDGTTTTINSTQLSVADKKITVGKGSGSSSAANESGFEVGVGADGASSNPSMLYSSSGTKFVINKPLDVTGNVTATRAVLTDGITDTGQAGSSTTFNNGGTTADFIVKSSGNATMLVVDGGTNRVGIGTASPASPLDVKGDFRITRGVDAGHASEGNWNFNISHEDAARYGSLYITPSVSTAEISLMSNKFRFTNGGRLGIGVTDPDTNLEVNIQGAADGNGIHITSTSTTNDPALKISRNNGAADAFRITPRGGAGSAYLAIAANASLDSGLNLGSNNGLSIGTTTAAGAGGLLVSNDIKTASRFGVGSAGNISTPALYHSTDADTGLYFPAANTIGLVTGGSEKVRIASDGAVTLKPNGITTGLRLQGRSSDNHFYVQWKSNDGSANYGSIGSLNSGALQYQTNTHIFQNEASNAEYMRINSTGVGIGDTDPPSTLTVVGTNTTDVAQSGGAGINGLHVSRTTTGGENLYMYMTDGNAASISWAGIGNIGRVESYGNNAFEIGSQQNIPVVLGQNNLPKLRIKGDITAQAKIGATYIESLYTPNGGVQNCRIFEDHLGKWVAVGYFAANAATSIQSTFSSVRGGPTTDGQTGTTQFSADWGDSYPTEVRYMGASDFKNFNETKTIDFIHGVPVGRPWKNFFNNAHRIPDGGTALSASLMGQVQGAVGSVKNGWECRGAYDGRGRWHNPSYTHHRMSDATSINCADTAFTTPTSNHFNWNAASDAKISVHHSFDYSGQDTAGYSAAFGRDDTVVAFFDDYPNSRNNMQSSTNNYGTAVYVLMKLPEMQSIGLQGARSRDHMPGEVVQTKVYERNADVAATSGATSTFGYLDFAPLYGNSLLEFNIHANTGSNDANTVVWKIYQGSSSALGTLIRRTGNQIINNDGNTDGQELPFSWTQYYQLNDDKKSIYRYTVNFNPSGATYWGHTYGSTAHSYFTIKEIKQEHNATGITD